MRKVVWTENVKNNIISSKSKLYINFVLAAYN